MSESRVISVLRGGDTGCGFPGLCESVAGEGLEGLALWSSVLLTVPISPVSKQQPLELSAGGGW